MAQLATDLKGGKKRKDTDIYLFILSLAISPLQRGSSEHLPHTIMIQPLFFHFPLDEPLSVQIPVRHHYPTELIRIITFIINKSGLDMAQEEGIQRTRTIQGLRVPKPARIPALPEDPRVEGVGAVESALLLVLKCIHEFTVRRCVVC